MGDDDRKRELLEKTAGAVVETITGMDFVGGVNAFLRDPKGRDPVIPPDLHRTKAIGADADGNVTCIRCSRKVPWGDAQMVGSDGFICGSCTMPVLEAPPNDLRVRRRIWPWLVAIPAVAIGLVAVIWHAHQADADAELAAQFPVETTATLARLADDWRAAEAPLATAFAPAPALASLALAEPCDLALTAAHRIEQASPDFASAIHAYVADLTPYLSRARFRSQLDFAGALLAGSAPLVLVVLPDTTYVADVTGLRCAGAAGALRRVAR